MDRLLTAALIAFAWAIVAKAQSAPNDAAPLLPVRVSSTSEIVHAFDGHSGFGHPESVLLSSRRHYLFVIWNCPYSGLDLNHVYAYSFDGEHWNQFYHGGIHSTPTSVKPWLDEIDDQLIIDGRAPKDRIKVPLASLPPPIQRPTTSL